MELKTNIFILHPQGKSPAQGHSSHSLYGGCLRSSINIINMFLPMKKCIYIFLSCTEPCRYVLKIQLHCIPSPWGSPLHRTSGNWSWKLIRSLIVYIPYLRLQTISKVFQIKQSPKGTPLTLINVLGPR